MDNKLEVLYEDNHIIVVVKPQNIPTQADVSGDMDMLTMVKEYVKEKYNKPGNVYIGLVHRLDRPTGGVMVFARTSKAADRLCEQMREGKWGKRYLAVVLNKPREKRLKLINYLAQNPRTNVVQVVPELTSNARRAELEYEVLDEREKVSLIDVKLLTGRKHQIRVQMKNIGCPVYGDVKYGGDKLAKGHNLALWAYELKFVHPTTQENMTFKVYPPEDKVPWSVFNLDIVK